ncbi:MAG: tetratricopeptide repeat protein [Flavobacteriales bacterium]
MIRALHGLANVYRYRDDYTTSLDYYIRTVKLAHRARQKDEEATALANMAKIYMYLNRPDDERAVLEEAARLREELGDTAQIIGGYSNLINLHLNYKNYDEAEELCLKTKTIIEKYGVDRVGHEHMCDFYRNMGLLSFVRKQFSQAEVYYKQGLESAIIDGSKKNIARVWGDLAQTYLALHNYSQAERCAKELLRLSEEIDHKRGQMLAFGYLADVYYSQAKYKKAFENHQSYAQLRDTLLNEENMKQMNEMHEKYESGKKEQQIKLLHKEKEIQAAVTQADTRRKNVVLISVSAVLLLSLGFVWFMLRSLRTTRMQKNIIESKQKEIVDSINYAKRLQQAILATPQEIKNHLPESFLFYKPKDIVAGDFYFFETTSTHIFIAAADCTGHGVPGAMVSVVCSNALTRCVKEFNLTDPGKILNKARELVTETFDKSGAGVKDGMDISFLSIQKTGEIKWAGANNPLWYVTNGTMKEIPPTKRPIGQSESVLEFASHTLELSSDTTLFLFTDGFADQFGGPSGKKFKYSNLKKLLSENALREPGVIHYKLRTAFETWMGNLEQVDDVCIIGVKM